MELISEKRLGDQMMDDNQPRYIIILFIKYIKFEII